MKTYKSIYAAIAVATLGLGLAAQATAGEYSRSYLDVDNLQIFISDDGGASNGGNTLKSFNFNLTNTSTLGGSTISSGDFCTGEGPTLGSNDCGPAGARADATVVTQGAPAQGENTFSFIGPVGAGNYSNADSLVDAAQLTGDGATSTEQIAVAEINSLSNASSLADISSTTGFTFSFTVAGANVIAVNFDAIWDQYVEINDPDAATALSQSNIKAEFELSNDVTGAGLLWRPGAGGCTLLGGIGGTCTVAEAGDINDQISVGTVPNSSLANNGSGAFSLFFDGLTDGDWTFSLNSVTSTLVSRTPQVPEPSILGLLGVAFAALGVASIRRKKIV